MKKIRRALALLMLFFAGCVASIHPIYTERDLIFVPGLLGTWGEEDSGETWVFSAHDPAAYRLVYTDDKGRAGTFVAHLVKAGGSVFLDLFPVELNDRLNEFYRLHFLQLHTWLLVDQVEPTLKMSFMRREWLQDFLKQKPAALRHESVREGIVITASTEELRSFLIKHSRTKDAFEEPSSLIRRTNRQ